MQVAFITAALLMCLVGALPMEHEVGFFDHGGLLDKMRESIIALKTGVRPNNNGPVPGAIPGNAVVPPAPVHGQPLAPAPVHGQPLAPAPVHGQPLAPAPAHPGSQPGVALPNNAGNIPKATEAPSTAGDGAPAVPVDSAAPATTAANDAAAVPATNVDAATAPATSGGDSAAPADPHTH